MRHRPTDTGGRAPVDRNHARSAKTFSSPCVESLTCGCHRKSSEIRTCPEPTKIPGNPWFFCFMLAKLSLTAECPRGCSLFRTATSVYHFGMNKVHKKCPTCGQTKGMHQFYNSRREKDGKEYQCSVCASARQKLLREENWNKIRSEERRVGKEVG